MSFQRHKDGGKQYQRKDQAFLHNQKKRPIRFEKAFDHFYDTVTVIRNEMLIIFIDDGDP